MRPDPMLDASPSSEELRKRIGELEEKLLAQRVGKRILFQLLEWTKAEQREIILKLEAENRRLKERNRKLARMLIGSRWHNHYSE